MNTKRYNVDPIFRDTITVSPKQIELGIYIRQYRRIHNLSQVQMANICSLYGEPLGVQITQVDISSYENFRHAPTKKKFQVLMNTLDIDITML